MRISHEKLIVSGEGWQYYVDTFFALLPTFIGDGAMPLPLWLCRYWETYPVDEAGKAIEMYRVRFANDPRKK